jgi:hypothetical protein
VKTLLYPAYTNARYRITATSPSGQPIEAFATTWELALKVYDILAAQEGTEIEIGLTSHRESFTWRAYPSGRRD